MSFCRKITFDAWTGAVRARVPALGRSILGMGGLGLERLERLGIERLDATSPSAVFRG